MIAIEPENAEWYTPPHILEAVYATLGTIDLDPCSNSHTEPNVKASRHFTIEDDGLNQVWDAETIFMNPPYGRPLKLWIKKLISELHYNGGHVKNAIVLIPAKTETSYWHELNEHAYFLCMIKGRLSFINPSGIQKGRNGTFGSAALLIHDNIETIDKFCENFAPLGILYKEVHTCYDY